MQIPVTDEMRESVRRVRETQLAANSVPFGWTLEVQSRWLGHQLALANLVIAAIEEQEQGESSHV